MKKTLVLVGLALILVLALAAPALAVKPANPGKAQKIDWHPVTGGSSDNVVLESFVPGHVNLNTPEGAVTMVINGVITLDSSTTYSVWIRQFMGYTGESLFVYAPLNYVALGYFTTDAYGHASFHYNIASDDLTGMTRDIQLAINTTPLIGQTVAATVKYTVIAN